MATVVAIAALQRQMAQHMATQQQETSRQQEHQREMASRQQEHQREMTTRQQEMAAQLQQIAVHVQPQNLVSAAYPWSNSNSMNRIFPGFQLPLAFLQVNAHGDQVQVVSLDIGLPMPRRLAEWFNRAPFLRWVLSITVCMLSIAAGRRLESFIGDAVVPVAVVFGACCHCMSWTSESPSIHRVLTVRCSVHSCCRRQWQLPPWRRPSHHGFPDRPNSLRRRCLGHLRNYNPATHSPDDSHVVLV